MVNIKINKQEYSVSEDLTILQACRLNNIDIPTLCYLEGINEVGACRMCLVEVEGVKDLVASCNNKVREGMSIISESERIDKARITNLKLILSEHNNDCDNCKRDGNCRLQDLKKKYHLEDVKNEKKIKTNDWKQNYSFIKDESKCIKCMRCISICDKVQSLGVWDLVNCGTKTKVALKENKDISLTKCVSCGQCVSNCPTAALSENDETNKLLEAINSNKKVVVQIAPAIRAAICEEFNLNYKECNINKIAAVLKEIGVDYVFDTNFSADLTIMEEANELIERLEETKITPMFTSCCPGWVAFLKKEYPELVGSLSSAKSPQQMLGAVIKSYFAQKIKVKPEDIYSVSIMPCLAKKLEKDLPGMARNNINDVDLVLSNRELIRLIKNKGIDIKKIKEVELDSPLGEGSGAAVIFGTSGGVMEAALRSAYKFVTKTEAPIDCFKNIRGEEGYKEAEFMLNGIELKVAVVSGLANARKLLERVKNKEVHYNFVEVMACPLGCINGGGQPINENRMVKINRSNTLYKLDESSIRRCSHNNPNIIKIYDEYFEKPLSAKAHTYLHVEHKEVK